MALLDTYNPRSVACQVEKLVEHFRNLPKLNQDGMLEPPERLALAIHSELATGIAAQFKNEAVFAVEQRLLALGDAIGTRYFLHGATAVKADKAVGLA